MCLEGTTEGWVGVHSTDGRMKTVLMSGPATEKARLPNCVLLRLTAAARVVEERSWRTFEFHEFDSNCRTEYHQRACGIGLSVRERQWWYTLCTR